MSKRAVRRGSKAYNTRKCLSCTFPRKFLHVGMTGSSDHVRVRTWQGWPVLLQQFYLGSDLHLLILGEGAPPRLELVGEFDFPSH